MILPANQHLRNSLPAQRRLRQWRELLDRIWRDLLWPQLGFRNVVGPLSHFPVSVHNVAIFLEPETRSVSNRLNRFAAYQFLNLSGRLMSFASAPAGPDSHGSLLPYGLCSNSRCKTAFGRFPLL
jgi:hypothetical protein